MTEKILLDMKLGKLMKCYQNNWRIKWVNMNVGIVTKSSI
jgi:hypothetical protein